MGATFSRVKTFSTGDTILASETNAEFDNILNNLTPAGVDDESVNETAMQATRDPYPAASADLAVSLQEEIQSLRYLIKQITGEANWYVDPDASIANLQGGHATLGVSAVQDGTNIIKTKIINIGTWNMDTTDYVLIAHGLTLAKIRYISAIIRADANDFWYPLNLGGNGQWLVGATNIQLSRVGSGSFDSTDFDTMGDDGNRGWITITYVV